MHALFVVHVGVKATIYSLPKLCIKLFILQILFGIFWGVPLPPGPLFEVKRRRWALTAGQRRFCDDVC